MGHDRVDWLKQRRGKTRVVTRGGGGATRSQYCCVSAGSHSVYLIAENGEVDLAGFACSLTARTGRGRQFCAPSALVSKNFTSDGSLKLGLARTQVKAIPSAPSAENSDTHAYWFEIEVPTKPEALKTFLAQNPSYTSQDIAKGFPEHYTLTVGITAKFTKGRLTYLYVDSSEID
jgi:hypothetical protein